YSRSAGGTTGGAGGSSTTVSDLASLRNAVKGDSAAIIYISGVIKGDGETIKVGSNKSILSKNGGGKDGLTGGGFLVKEAKNVIIRGLAMPKSPAPTDLVGIQESTNVWVDHCTFTSSLDVDKDFYDGQLDITHAADFVTVSHNIFQQAWKTSLVGHSDNNGAENKGHLRVTYHGNHFFDVNSRVPSLRFGTGHIFNNYYESVLGSGINARKSAQVLVESNYF
ncbi:polysaccharide lyase family 1 protein, partial [Rhodotorula graminis WP1]